MLRQGEEFCRAVAGGDIQHPNLYVDCELQKTVSAIVPRISSSLDCEGIKLDFGHVRAFSKLAERRYEYPLELSPKEMTDIYTCE